jgi:hypothetical protein
MLKRVLTLLACLLLCSPAFARADDAQLFIAATAFTGVHRDAQTTLKNAYVLAFPSFALRARHKHLEVLIEDVPPIGPIRQSGLYGHGVKVGYGDAAATYWMPGGKFAIGIGDSLYVRENDYGNGSFDGVRSAGPRYELVTATPLRLGQRIVARLAVSPAMHQRFMEWVSGGPQFHEFGKASLVDGSLQFEQQRGGGHTWVLGVRYLNYAGGNFPPFWDHAQERTGVVTAVAAWGFTIGGFH